MSRWTDTYKDHQFHALWKNLRGLLKTTAPREGDDQAAQEFARLRKMVGYLSSLLKQVDPELATPSLLNDIEGSAQGIIGELSNYASDGNNGHLRNANNNADGIAARLSQTPLGPPGVDAPDIASSVAAYQETLELHAKTYFETVSQLVSESTEQVEQLRARARAGEEALAKLEGRIAAMEAQLPMQLSSFNTTFQASESQRAERYEKWTESYQQRLDEEFKASAAKAGAFVDVLASYKDQAAKVLGTVVDTAQAGAYATYASEEKNSANLFRRFAIVMMAAAALVLFLPEVAHIVKEASGYTVDWQKALARLPFSLVLFAPALYLARESSRHRTNEVVNRRRQHILTTIGPYLALLDPKKAEEIKTEVAKSIFSDSLPVMEEKTNAETGNLLAQLSNLVSAAKRGR